MQKAVDKLNENATRLGDMGDVLDLRLSELLLQTDSLIESQKDERLKIQEANHIEIEKLMAHHAKEIANWKHIVIGLIVVICLIIGSLVGGAVYLFNNYDIGFGNVQDLYVGGDGNPTINDGSHYDRTD